MSITGANTSTAVDRKSLMEGWGGISQLPPVVRHFVRCMLVSRIVCYLMRFESPNHLLAPRVYRWPTYWRYCRERRFETFNQVLCTFCWHYDYSHQIRSNADRKCSRTKQSDRLSSQTSRSSYNFRKNITLALYIGVQVSYKSIFYF